MSCIQDTLAWNPKFLTDNWLDSRQSRVLFCDINTPLTTVLPRFQACQVNGQFMVSLFSFILYFLGHYHDIFALFVCLKYFTGHKSQGCRLTQPHTESHNKLLLAKQSKRMLPHRGVSDYCRTTLFKSDPSPVIRAP